MADNYQVKDANRELVTIAAKDRGSGVKANRVCPQVLDLDVAEANPMPTKEVAGTTGGAGVYSFLSTAAVQAAAIKASAGQVYALHFFNIGAEPVYLRLYNQATSPAAGDNAAIVYRAVIPGNTKGAGFVVPIPPGSPFTVGIGIRVTAGIADTNNSVLAASQVIGNVFFK